MNQAVWNKRFLSNRLPWDLGEVSRVISRLVSACANPPAEVIVIGCGQGWEVQYLLECGFDVTALDIAPAAIDLLRHRLKWSENLSLRIANVLDLPADLLESFDIVIEHNCLCSIQPEDWNDYLYAVRSLLRRDGMYIGSLLNFTDNSDNQPPFGLSSSQAYQLLNCCFEIKHMIQAEETFPPKHLPLADGVYRVPQLEFIAIPGY